MHDKPGVKLVELPPDPHAVEILLSEARRDGYVIDGFPVLGGTTYAALEQGY